MQSEHTEKDDIINDATLVVATGCASIAGIKPVNEDAVAVHTPTDRHALLSRAQPLSLLTVLVVLKQAERRVITR